MGEVDNGPGRPPQAADPVTAGDRAHGKSERWYTRRDGVIRGPYPAGQISRYILLGRIREDDELSMDQQYWQPVDECQALIPEVMKLPPTEENLQRLLMARMREDERQPGDRRDRQPEPPAHIKERRTGSERRQLEPELFLRHRKLKQDVIRSVSNLSGPYRIPLSLVAIVLCGLLLAWVTQSTEPDEALPDCQSPALAGVNWDNCNLSGVELQDAILNGAMIRNAKLDGSLLAGAQLANVRLDYSSMNITDLSAADLSNGVLVGASLNGANLRNARLYKANLAYANLSGALVEGADFTGAVLDHAIWVDQRECAAGSVGQCVR